MGGKGTVEFFVWKLQLRKALMEWPETAGIKWSRAVQDGIANVFANWKNFRASTGYPNSDKQPDQSWRCGWPDSADEYFSIVESLVYGVDRDIEFLRPMFKNRKSATDVLNSSMIQELLDVVKSKNESEKALSADANPAPTAKAAVAAPADGDTAAAVEVQRRTQISHRP